MIRSYLDWLLAVPWGKKSDERLDPKLAREILDTDHAGLDDVKTAITISFPAAYPCIISFIQRLLVG